MPTKNTLLAPIHPGEILLEEFMKPNGINPHQLAMALRVPANRISAIVEGDRGITADTALPLGRFFRTDPSFWMRLQATYDIRTAMRKNGAEIERDVHPRIA